MTGVFKKWFWWHWQNLNKDSKIESRFPWCGRIWIHKTVPEKGHPFAGGGSWAPTIRFSWYLRGQTFCHFEVGIGGDEEDFEISIAFPPVAFWLTFERWIPHNWTKNIKWWRSTTWPYETGVRIHSSAIWWQVWRSEDQGWSSSTPRWRQGSFHFDDFFLGDAKYSEETLIEVQESITLRDGDYPVTVRLFESTWKRPRWFAKKMVRARVEVVNPEGISTGEFKFGSDNSTMSSTFPADSISEAIEKFTTRIETERRKYGYYLSKYRELG